MLYNFQAQGIDWLRRTKRGILADSMGLGKTVQALMASSNAESVLVVCPKVSRGVWVEEIAKWMQSASMVIDGSPTKRKKCLAQHTSRYTIVNYELLISGTLRDLFKSYQTIIFDEAHRLKNRRSKTFKAAKLLVSAVNPLQLFLLTGTPILNKAEDLWPLLHLINPQKYSSYWRWVEEVCITRTAWFNSSVTEIIGVKEPAKLKQQLRPLLLRREKEEVLELPPLTLLEIPVPMLKEQAIAYQQMVKEFKCTKGAHEVLADSPLARITYLKLLSIDSGIPFCSRGSSNKLEAVKELLVDITYPAIVFTTSARFARTVGEVLNVPFITGEVLGTVREQYLQAFRENEIPLLVLTIGTCGMSVNLQNASTVIFTDVTWVPGLNAQAIDRVRRIGVKSTVAAILLTSVGTIEEKVLKILGDKQKLFDETIPAVTYADLEGI